MFAPLSIFKSKTDTNLLPWIKYKCALVLNCFFSGEEATCYQSTKEKVSAIFNHPKFQHFNLVLSFFLLKFLLQTADMVTDVVTAVDFFNNGHIYWSICTIGLVFLPFGARIIQVFVQIASCYKISKSSTFPFLKTRKNEARLRVLSEEMPSLLWTFPLFQPLRQV